MSVQFSVLGSGSSGNAALLMTPTHHVLIDAGFAPDEMAARMLGTEASWETLDAVVLTHTHGDHLKKHCLNRCAQHEVRFYCHERHAAALEGGKHFNKLKRKGLLQIYGDASFTIDRTLQFAPVRVPHDADPTYGFRIEASFDNADGSSTMRKLGYLVDLGVCEDVALEAVVDVDLLALEFNHDVRMERNSGRHPMLIQRVLGPEGHLSNAQAAEVFHRVLSRNDAGPQVLVQMHLSRECNRADIAYQAAQEVLMLSGARTRVYSTRQDRRGTVHCL